MWQFQCVARWVYECQLLSLITSASNGRTQMASVGWRRNPFQVKIWGLDLAASGCGLLGCDYCECVQDAARAPACLHTLHAPRIGTAISNLALLSQHRLLASFQSGDGCVVWDTEAGTLLNTFHMHLGPQLLPLPNDHLACVQLAHVLSGHGWERKPVASMHAWNLNAGDSIGTPIHIGANYPTTLDALPCKCSSSSCSMSSCSSSTSSSSPTAGVFLLSSDESVQIRYWSSSQSCMPNSPVGVIDLYDVAQGLDQRDELSCLFTLLPGFLSHGGVAPVFLMVPMHSTRSLEYHGLPPSFWQQQSHTSAQDDEGKTDSDVACVAIRPAPSKGPLRGTIDTKIEHVLVCGFDTDMGCLHAWEHAWSTSSPASGSSSSSSFSPAASSSSASVASSSTSVVNGVCFIVTVSSKGVLRVWM